MRVAKGKESRSRLLGKMMSLVCQAKIEEADGLLALDRRSQSKLSGFASRPGELSSLPRGSEAGQTSQGLQNGDSLARIEGIRD